MADDRGAVEREELIARLRDDLGSQTPLKTVVCKPADAGDAEDDLVADAEDDLADGGSPPHRIASFSESALQIADRILAAASVPVPR